MPEPYRLDAGQRHLCGRLGRAQDPPHAHAARRFGAGQRSRHRPQAPVEPELAQCSVTIEPLGRELARRGEDRERDREIEAGAFLPQPGRGEVDRDAPEGPLELGARHAATNPLACLVAGLVGEPHDRERGDASLQVRLDVDRPGLEPDDGVSEHSREHPSTLRAKPA